MAAAALPAIDRRYESVEGAIASLQAVEAHFVANGDWRGVFVSAYLILAREIQQRLERGAFNNNPWVERYWIESADRYRRALGAYAGVLDEPVPDCWLVAFDLAQRGSALVVRNLVLGFNAHLNYDLPLALTTVGIEPNRARCQVDHTSVNEAIQSAVRPVHRRLSRLYAPEMQMFDQLSGPFDEMLTHFSFLKSRRAAWCWGEMLFAAKTAQDFASVRRQMEQHAGRRARMIAGTSLVQAARLSATPRFEATGAPRLLW